MRKDLFTLWSTILVLCCGCGTLAPVSLSQRLVGVDGELIVVNDVKAIVDDAGLSNDQKRDALGDLGIEDEKLIDALLTL